MQFSPFGNLLVVTEKATNRILSWRVGRDGRLGDVTITPSAGQTPFGFDFTRLGVLLVSEAFGERYPRCERGVVVHRPSGSGAPELRRASVGTMESAACWVVVSRDGRHAYTTNTASGTVSGYRVSPFGDLRLLDDDGITANVGAGSGPIDLAFSNGDRFLRVLAGASSEIATYSVRGDGSLVSLGTVGGLPAGTNGLVAFLRRRRVTGQR